MDDLCIWWVDQLDYEAIGPELQAEFPAYIRTEYRSRAGRPGRGRLWVAPEIEKAYQCNIQVSEWPDSPMGRRLGLCGGIVVRVKDVPRISLLPGMLTDFKLRRLEIDFLT